MVDYALRFARTNVSEYTDRRWPYAIRADFTKRLDRSIEPSLEFSYTLGFHLPYLSYLDEEWIRLNINHIFPQRDEDPLASRFFWVSVAPECPRRVLLAPQSTRTLSEGIEYPALMIRKY